MSKKNSSPKVERKKGTELIRLSSSGKTRIELRVYPAGHTPRKKETTPKTDTSEPKS